MQHTLKSKFQLNGKTKESVVPTITTGATKGELFSSIPQEIRTIIETPATNALRTAKYQWETKIQNSATSTRINLHIIYSGNGGIRTGLKYTTRKSLTN